MLTKTILHKQPKLGTGCKIIFGAVVGSHAYGTNVEGSDIDYAWVYVQSPLDLFMNGYKPQVNISKDEVAYELRRFLELCKKANPTVLQILFSPDDCIVAQDESWKAIKDLKYKFLTKECKFSFVGYAISQIDKARGLDKKMNYSEDEKVRKGILDFCYFVTHEKINHKQAFRYHSAPIKNLYTVGQLKQMGLSCIPHVKNVYNLYFDIRYLFKGVVKDEYTSNEISLSEVPEDANCEGMLYFNEEEYTRHCKRHKEYLDWLINRNTQRYVDVENHGQMIDGKNLLHCVRLIEMGIEIAKNGVLQIRRANAEFLKDIRRGKMPLDQILLHCENKIKDMKDAFDQCTLPDKFCSDSHLDVAHFNIRIKFYKLQQSKKSVSI